MDIDESKTIYVGVGVSLGVTILVITVCVVLIKLRRKSSRATSERQPEFEVSSSSGTNKIQTVNEGCSDLSTASAESENYETKLDISLNINEEESSFTNVRPRVHLARNDSEHYAISASLRRSISSLQAVKDTTIPAVHLKQNWRSKSLPADLRKHENRGFWNRYLFGLNLGGDNKDKVEDVTEDKEIRQFSSLPDIRSESQTDLQRDSVLSIITV